MSSPQAGWYQDPQNPQGQRYWDGTQWTNQTQQATPPPPPPGAYQTPTFQTPGVPMYQGPGATQQGSYAAQPVSFSEAVKRLCTKWTTRGRASRSEYWFSALAFFAFYIVGALVGSIGVDAISLIVGLAELAGLVSLLFMAARRYHDSAKSGGWVLLQALLHIVSGVVLVFSIFAAGFAKVFGASDSDVKSFGATALVAGLVFLSNIIWSLIWLCLPGKAEKNRFDD